MSVSILKLAAWFAPVAALVALVVAMDGTWATAQPDIQGESTLAAKR